MVNTYKLITLCPTWDNKSKYCCYCISLFQKKRGGTENISIPRNGSFQSSSCRLHGGYRWTLHCNKCKDFVLNICVGDIGEHVFAHYVYCNECKDSVVDACEVNIDEHFFAHYLYCNECKGKHRWTLHCNRYIKLRGEVSNISVANIRTWSFDHQGHAISGKLTGGKKCSKQGMFYYFFWNFLLFYYFFWNFFFFSAGQLKPCLKTCFSDEIEEKKNTEEEIWLFLWKHFLNM